MVPTTNDFQFPLHRDNDCYFSTSTPLLYAERLSVPSSSGQRLLLPVSVLSHAAGSTFQFPLHRDNDCY